MALDTAQDSPSYLAGRLLAILEALEAAVVPEAERSVFYSLLPQVIQTPGLAVKAAATRMPAWIGKLAARDAAASELHRTRFVDLLGRIPTPHLPVDTESQSWASLGYHHQVSADVRAGLRPDQMLPITTAEVADLLGYQGPNAIKTASSWLSRHGIKPVGRDPGKGGSNRWSYTDVEAARAAAPGRGARAQGRSAADVAPPDTTP